MKYLAIALLAFGACGDDAASQDASDTGDPADTGDTSGDATPDTIDTTDGADTGSGEPLPAGLVSKPEPLLALTPTGAYTCAVDRAVTRVPGEASFYIESIVEAGGGAIATYS